MCAHSTGTHQLLILHIAGVMVLALSPDEQSVLLVHEYGHWKLPGGAVEPGDSFLETAIRELKEEVDVEVDLDGYAPRCLGGYHLPRSRDDIVNDNLKCLALRARSTVFTPDMQEIHRAKWVMHFYFGITRFLR